MRLVPRLARENPRSDSPCDRSSGRSPLARIAVLVIALALVSGCGSSPLAYEEVPGDPVELKVPGDASALAPAAATATPTPAATEDATGDPAAQATPQAATGETTETAPEGTAGGGTEAPGGEDGATGEAPPGSDASEEFCSHNPGAC